MNIIMNIRENLIASFHVIYFVEKPHNPMINAGAIITCSLLKTLIKPEMTLAEKFDYTMSFFQVCTQIALKFNSFIWSKGGDGQN